MNFRVAEARLREYGSRAFLERKVVHFEHSQILWLTALVVPLLGLFLGWAWRRRRERVTRFIHANLVEQLTLGLSAARRKAKLALLLGVVLLLFIALARPKVGYALQKTETRSLDILVAVDTSRSMLATDQSPNRLERAKLAVLDLMRLAKRDRLGLIAFSGTAFLQCPLTIDRNAFIQNVNSLTTDIIPQGGTAIGEAVTEALRTFEKEEDNHKVLVLMTDGEDHEAGVTDAAQKANKIGMKIFTIGLGSTEGELIQLPDPQTGRLEFLKDASGNVIKSRLNETLLRTLSTDTGAFYLPLQGADTMERLYEAGLAGLTPNRIENQMTKRYIERYQWPLGLAILLLLSEMLLREGRENRQQTAPQPGPPLPRLACCCSPRSRWPRRPTHGVRWSRTISGGRCASTRNCWRTARKTPGCITTPGPPRMVPGILRRLGIISTRRSPRPMPRSPFSNGLFTTSATRCFDWAQPPRIPTTKPSNGSVP